jgi:uncharacterized protein
MTTATSAAPIGNRGRIQSLDILRGIAVFGILLMNITAFALVFPAYYNPTIDGGSTGLNLATYEIVTVLFEGTMRGIFSLLFGAGIVLLTSRMEDGGAGLMTAEIHFRRMLWLLLFGFIHWALMLWIGEILFAYAICGLLLFAPRKLPALQQLVIAGLILSVAAFIANSDYHATKASESAYQSVEQSLAEGTTPTAEQQSVIDEWMGHQAHAMISEEGAEGQRALHNLPYWEAVKAQFPMSYDYQWATSPRWLLLDIVPFMLIGMAFLKIGLLDGKAKNRTYLAMLALGYGVGIPLGMYEVSLTVTGEFSAVSIAEADRTYQISRLAMVVGHLGLLLLIIKSGIVAPLQRAFAAAGKMALTNYLMQTVICVTIFYGFGFALFGAFERHELYYIVGSICTVQLIWSVLWLKFFRFGPFEWLWRSLTYWKLQPMKISQGDPPKGQMLGAT